MIDDGGSKRMNYCLLFVFNFFLVVKVSIIGQLGARLSIMVIVSSVGLISEHSSNVEQFTFVLKTIIIKMRLQITIYRVKRDWKYFSYQ